MSRCAASRRSADRLVGMRGRLRQAQAQHVPGSWQRVGDERPAMWRRNAAALLGQTEAGAVRGGETEQRSEECGRCHRRRRRARTTSIPA